VGGSGDLTLAKSLLKNKSLLKKKHSPVDSPAMTVDSGLMTTDYD